MDNEETMDLSWLKLPQIDVMMLNERAKTDTYFKKNFKYDLTKIFLDKLRYQYEHNQNIIINCYGQPGCGKSYAALSLAGQSPQPPSIDCVFFRLDELDAYLPRLHKGDSIIVDERVQTYGTGTKRLESQYILMIETLRKMKVDFWIVSPIPRARKHAFFLIQGLRLTDYKTVNYVELQDNEMNCFGHVKIDSPVKVLGNKFVDEYEKRKTDFLKTVQKRNLVDYLAEYAEEVMKFKNFKCLDEVFKKDAELKKKRHTGIPRAHLIEIITERYPELRRNVEATALAVKINEIKILNGEWAPSR